MFPAIIACFGLPILCGLWSIYTGRLAMGIMLVLVGAIVGIILGLPVLLFEGIYAMWHLSFFLVEGVYLWFLLGVFLIATLVTIEYEKPGWCTFLIAVTLALLEFYSPWHPMSYAMQHPVEAVIAVGSYMVVGIFWIIVKWLSHVHNIGRKFDQIKSEIINSLVSEYKQTALFTGPRDRHGTPTDPSYLPQDSNWVKADQTLTADGVDRVFQIAARRLSERQLPLQVSDHKAELYMWWIGWPLSMFWTLLNDPIKRIWWLIYDHIGGLLQAISNSRFKLD